ncbi:DUF4328 domain-containing protein [Nonomuraea longicatena]|uniref:DUF4328 domain-containing protein n=1 Tax=Nonomuraea longicatena TaxID=83682 RepID=A0ABN1P2E4_9ACTN
MNPPPVTLKPVRIMAIVVIVMLCVDSLAALLTLGADLYGIALMERLILDPDTVSEAELATSDTIDLAVEGLWSGAFLGSGVAFLVWLFRVRANAEVFDADSQRYSKVSLVLGWVVPIVCLWYPKKFVDDIWLASLRAQVPPGAQVRRSGLVWGWWLCWVAWLIANTFATLAFRWATDAQGWLDAYRIEIVFVVVSWVTAGLAIAVVRRITAMQEEVRARLAAMPPQPVE